MLKINENNLKNKTCQSFSSFFDIFEQFFLNIVYKVDEVNEKVSYSGCNDFDLVNQIFHLHICKQIHIRLTHMHIK